MENNFPEPDSKSFQDYLFFWVGQLISILGSSIVQFTIIWWVTLTYESALYLSLAAMLGFGSTIAVSLFAGVYVDRWSRRKLIATVDSLEVLMTIVLIYLFWTGQASIIHILIVLTLRGIFQGFHETAIFAIIPLLVSKDKLTKINSWQYLANGIIFMIGPVIGAIMLGVFGVNNIHIILWIDAVTFGIAIIPMLLIHIPTVKIKKEKIEKPSFRVEFNEGVSFIRKNEGLLSLLSAFTSANFFGVSLFILLPLIVVQQSILIDLKFINEVSLETSLAIMMVVTQIGSISGSLIMSSVTLFKKNTTGVAVGLFSMSIGIILVAVGSWSMNIPVILFGMFLNGFSLPIANVSSQTIWQTVVPMELQGRVFSVRRTIAQISSPIAMAVTGLIAESIGSVTWILITGIGGFLIMTYIWQFTSFTMVEQILSFSDTEIDAVEEEKIGSEVPTAAR
jgi:DHA3 family macrolide efflux protein-like MFS transporter